MSGEAKMGLLIFGIVLVIGLVIFGIMGPAGCSRTFQGWKAGAYGADWLVVQYAQDGHVICYWELNDKSIGNEESSDGIYFTDEYGNVVEMADEEEVIKDMLLKGRIPEPDE